MYFQLYIYSIIYYTNTFSIIYIQLYMCVYVYTFFSEVWLVRERIETKKHIKAKKNMYELWIYTL